MLKQLLHEKNSFHFKMRVGDIENPEKSLFDRENPWQL